MKGRPDAACGAVIILGEDEHDRRALKTLIAGLRRDIPEGSIKSNLRKPMALVKNVPPTRLPSQATRVAATLRAVAVREPIRCVFMHEDADAVEPAHLELIEKIEQCYRALPWPVHAVVPAWETETWWLLFPAAVVAVHPSWRMPDQYAGRDLGKIRNAKEQLRRAVRPPNARPTFRTYAESDSEAIAAKIVERGLLSPPWSARCKSWETFLTKVARA